MNPQAIVDSLKSDPEAIAALQRALSATEGEWQNIAKAARSLGLDRKKLDNLIDAGVLKGALRDVSNPLKIYRAIQVNVPAADKILRERVK